MSRTGEKKKSLLALYQRQFDKGIVGDFAEFGCHAGHNLRHLRPLADEKGRKVVGFDSFRGLVGRTEHDGTNRRVAEGLLAPPEGSYEALVAEGFTVVAGDVRETAEAWLERVEPEGYWFSLVLLDMDLYAPTKAALEALLDWNVVGKGTIVIADEFQLGFYPGEKKAVTEVLPGAGWKKWMHGAYTVL